MALIALKCPSCNGDIQINDGSEFGFCMYCGTKILVSELVDKSSKEVQALLKIAETSAESSYEVAFTYACKATELDPSSTDAWIARAKYAPNAKEKSFALETAGKLTGEDSKLDAIENMKEQVPVNVCWDSMVFNWGCKISVDGDETALDGGMKTTKFLEPGTHKFIFIAPSKNVQVEKDVDVQGECTVRLSIKKSFFGSSLEMDVA